MRAPDSHMIQTPEGDWVPGEEVNVFVRAASGELRLLHRQSTYNFLGQPRYIVYWREVPDVIPDEHELL